MDWEIPVKYGHTVFKLEAEKVYESNQVMRIKVYGKKGYILFENNYPYLLHTGSKKAIKWKVKEGNFAGAIEPQEARLIADIISELDYQVRGKHNQLSHAEYLRITKR